MFHFSTLAMKDFSKEQISITTLSQLNEAFSQVDKETIY